MKYLESSPFGTGANSSSYRDNYDKVFSRKEEKEEKKEQIIAVDVTESYVHRYYVRSTSGDHASARARVKAFMESWADGNIAERAKRFSDVADTGTEDWVGTNPELDWRTETLVSSERVKLAEYLLEKQTGQAGRKHEK